MLVLTRGDVLVVPRMPSLREFSVVTGSDEHDFNDQHDGEIHPDLAHVVRVDPVKGRRYEYDSCEEANQIAAKFSNYRSAITFVAKPTYRADILLQCARSASGVQSIVQGFRRR